MTGKINVNENERKVLEQLAEDDEVCFYFKSLAGDGLDIKAVRRACRSLARKGLAEFHRGLFNEDGQVAGSGYGITSDGLLYINPCDISGCGGRVSYDYKKDVAGKFNWDVGFDTKTSRRIRECEDHYRKSATAEQKQIL